MSDEQFDYYRDTSPEEFLADLRAILVDGDNMKPNRLIEEINWMTAQFMDAHKAREDAVVKARKEVERWGILNVEIDSSDLDDFL